MECKERKISYKPFIMTNFKPTPNWKEQYNESLLCYLSRWNNYLILPYLLHLSFFLSFFLMFFFAIAFKANSDIPPFHLPLHCAFLKNMDISRYPQCHYHPTKISKNSNFLLLILIVKFNFHIILIIFLPIPFFLWIRIPTSKEETIKHCGSAKPNPKVLSIINRKIGSLPTGYRK